MRCVDFERRLNRMLDDRQRPEDDASLQAHAMKCHECNKLFVGQAQLRELLHRSIPPLTAGFSEATVAQAVKHHPDSGRRTWRIAISLTTAAVLLIMVWPAARRTTLSAFSRDKSKRGSNIRAVERNHSPTTIAAWNAKPIDSKFERNAVVPPQVNAEPEDVRQLIRDFWKKLPEVRNEQFEPIDRIAGGFRPLASTLGAAIDALRRSFPVVRDAAPSEPQALFPGWNPTIGLS